MSARYLSPQEVADVLGCSVKTVYRRVKDGELMAIYVGSRIRVEANSMPTPGGPRRITPRQSKYGGPGTLKAVANQVKANRGAR